VYIRNNGHFIKYIIYIYMKDCNIKKIKTHKVHNGILVKNALIIENVQNCFFTGGSMGFIKKVEEKTLLEKINKLINLKTADDKYTNASFSGVKVEKGKIEKLIKKKEKGVKNTGSRQKYFFDYIIFTQIANVPDHWTFASHHYLRNQDYRFFTQVLEGKKQSFDCSTKKGLEKCKGNIFLLPDHALTDGSDKLNIKGKEVSGIDFHNDLDTSSLYRPNKEFDNSVMINKPEYHNRGFIITKGSVNKGPYSAFNNTLNDSTCLNKFLEKNNISSIYVCGIGRENSIKNTLLDSINYNFLKERVLIYDSSMPILVEPLKEEDDESRFVSKDNDWSESLKEKNIVIQNTQEVLDLQDLEKTRFDRPKFFQAANNMSKFFGNAGDTVQFDYNEYLKLLPKKSLKNNINTIKANTRKANNRKANTRKANNRKANTRKKTKIITK
jgi:nicotinamidase-related amidase